LQLTTKFRSSWIPTQACSKNMAVRRSKLKYTLHPLMKLNTYQVHWN